MFEHRTPAQVVRDAREASGLSYRRARDEINKFLPENHGVSFNAIQAWESESYSPPFYVFAYLRDHATGWVRDFAADALAAIDLDVEQRR